MEMEMKERQRWTTEEDALLRAYVKQFGPREWSLVSQRMNTPLNRDAKSCLERWKNYLKPGIKKGSLTEEEQRLVIHLQAKHGNKWKKIAAEIPGRTAKRLGKWWEVFKEKQQKEQKENERTAIPLQEGKYDRILETFAEKLVNEHPAPPYIMAAPNGGFLQTDQSIPASSLLPPWLSNSNSNPAVRPPSPSVTLSLSSSAVPSSTIPASAPLPWMQLDQRTDNTPIIVGNFPPHMPVSACGENLLMSELGECCRELEEGHHAWTAHKKESAWRLKRVELQLESEKASRKKEKMEEIEAKVKALREEQKIALERIEADYREQLAGLKRDAEIKEQKLVEQWTSKHIRLSKFLEQMGFRPWVTESNGR